MMGDGSEKGGPCARMSKVLRIPGGSGCEWHTLGPFDCGTPEEKERKENDQVNQGWMPTGPLDYLCDFRGPPPKKKGGAGKARFRKKKKDS